jgi:hypothetical protein
MSDENTVTCEKCGVAYGVGAWPYCPHEQGSNGVVGDDIKGGVFYAQNGMCHPDGTPRAFTKMSDLNKFAKAMGLKNHVEHNGGKEGDKSRHTQRFL